MRDEEALGWASKFGVEPTGVERLEGYESLNFLIRTETSKYVLKFYPPGVSKRELLQAEDEVLAHLSEAEDINAPVPVVPRVATTMTGRTPSRSASCSRR